MKTNKRRFIVEIEIPEETGDLCWDHDETGLQAFHDCVVSTLPATSLDAVIDSLNEKSEYKNFIERQCRVRKSFKVIKALNEK